eukprot:Gb_12735 [translate_table: standard]
MGREGDGRTGEGVRGVDEGRGSPSFTPCTPSPIRPSPPATPHWSKRGYGPHLLPAPPPMGGREGGGEGNPKYAPMAILCHGIQQLGLEMENEVCLIDVLPMDALTHCFLLLSSFKDLAQTSLVCRKWREAVKQSLARRDKLSFAGWRMDDCSLARLVQGAFGLKELDIFKTQVIPVSAQSYESKRVAHLLKATVDMIPSSCQMFPRGLVIICSKAGGYKPLTIFPVSSLGICKNQSTFLPCIFLALGNPPPFNKANFQPQEYSALDALQLIFHFSILRICLAITGYHKTVAPKKITALKRAKMMLPQNISPQFFSVIPFSLPLQNSFLTKEMTDQMEVELQSSRCLKFLVTSETSLASKKITTLQCAKRVFLQKNPP